MVWVLLVLVLGAAYAWVVGGSRRGVLALLAEGPACAGGWLVVGWLAVLVVPVVSGVRVVPSAVFGFVVVGVAPVVVEGVDAVDWWWCCCVAAVGGAGDLVGEGAAGGAPGVGAAGDANGEGVVGNTLDGCWCSDSAVGSGPRHSWRRFPWALLAAVLALAVFAVPGVGALLGVFDADGVAGVVLGGVAVVAVVEAPGCCR